MANIEIDVINSVVSNIVPKKILRKVQSNSLMTVSDSLKNSFGPNGSVTAIRKSDSDKHAGITIYTKDGNTILSNIQFNRPIETTMVDDLKDITGDTVKKVGDGTTSAIILANHIFQQLVSAHEKFGIEETKLVDMLKTATKNICELIEQQKKNATIDDIYDIALISTNGNKEIATNIMNIYKEYNMDVYIDVGISNTTDNKLKTYDGITFEQGYYNPGFINNEQNHTSEIRNANLYIFEDAIDTPEMRAFFDKIIYDNIYAPYAENDPSLVKPTVILSTGFGADMRSKSDNIMQMMANCEPSKRPPLLVVTNIHDMDLLNDLAKLSNAKLIKKYIDPAAQQVDIEQGLAATPDTVHNFAGKVELVSADISKTKFINPILMHDADGNYSKTYNQLIADLESCLKNYEDTRQDIVSMSLLRKRIQSLKSNIVEYLIGGIAITDRDSVKDLVEDAVLNCRSAVKDGVGYGANFEGFRAVTTLEKMSIKDWNEKDIDDLQRGEVFNIYNIISQAYIQLLMSLYSGVFDNDQQATAISITQSLAENKPYNIRTKKYDGKVLSSIKSDQVILDAISRIIGLSFMTNQYLCQAPAYNVYVE